MQIPTTPSNYSLAQAIKNGVDEATTTVMEQAMLDAIRANGDDKYIIVGMDRWTDTHYFSTQYGTNSTPWAIDSLFTPKVVYSDHYYPDSDHSGSFSNSIVPSDTTVTNEVTPFFTWCSTQNVPCYIGEYGVPNTSEWQATLTHILDLVHLYSIVST